MAQPSPCASPGVRRRSDGSVRESLFFPVSERNEQERLEALVRRRAGGAERRGGGGGEAREHLDNRPKRWTWGGPPDGAEGEYDGRQQSDDVMWRVGLRCRPVDTGGWGRRRQEERCLGRRSGGRGGRKGGWCEDGGKRR